MVESFDQALGRLRSKLGQLGLARNTIIILTSDNGGLRFEGGSQAPVTDNSPLRAGKGHLYEGGIREPLLVYWPGVTKAGAVCDFPVSSIDFLPTILEMAGGGTPRPGDVDGVSLTTVLRGKSAPGRDGTVLALPALQQPGGSSGRRHPRP